MKMCEHILKKRQRPNTIQILKIILELLKPLNVKKERA